MPDKIINAKDPYVCLVMHLKRCLFHVSTFTFYRLVAIVCTSRAIIILNSTRRIFFVRIEISFWH